MAPSFSKKGRLLWFGTLAHTVLWKTDLAGSLKSFWDPPLDGSPWRSLKAPSLRVKSLSFSVLPSWILHGNACLQPRLPFWGAQQEPSIPTPPPLPRGLQIQLACEVALGWALGKAWTQSMPA